MKKHTDSKAEERKLNSLYQRQKESDDQALGDMTLGASLTPAPEVNQSRWQKILEGKGQEVIDEIKSI